MTGAVARRLAWSSGDIFLIDQRGGYIYRAKPVAQEPEWGDGTNLAETVE
jgi:hypothetical protein